MAFRVSEDFWWILKDQISPYDPNVTLGTSEN